MPKLHLVLPLAAACMPAPVHAQSYPAKPIRIVCPAAPGGISDILSRVAAQRLGAQYNQQVIVENRTGSGGHVAGDFVAKAAPDGYTLLQATIAESGIAGTAGFDTSGWFSMYAAPKTSPAIIKKLSAEILALLGTADMRERLLTFGATPLPGTPDDLRKQLAREVPAWRKVIQEGGLKVE